MFLIFNKQKGVWFHTDERYSGVIGHVVFVPYEMSLSFLDSLFVQHKNFHISRK